MAEMGERMVGRRRGDRIVGTSDSMRETLEQAASAARSQLPVVINGPAGSGKKQIARAVHAWSSRASGKFVVFSTLGVDYELHCRELLGVQPAADPLLSGGHDGALARAAGGTLVVDGLEALSSAARNALVQSLSNDAYQRDGQDVSTPLRARVIGTTTTDGASLLDDLPIQSVRLAPLSARSEDILPLAAHFLALFSQEEGVQAVGFTADARRCLLEENWAGNVRELRERIRQAVRLTRDGAISIEALFLAGEGEEVPSFKDAKRAFETRYVESLLRRCSGNISRAARLAKKDRKDFYDVIRRTGIDPGKFRG